MTSSESHQASRNFSRSSWGREANPESHPSIRPAKPSRTSALGLAPIAPRITSGTPIPVAAGRPSSPGTNVSQIASRLARPASLSVIVTNASNYQTHFPLARSSRWSHLSHHAKSRVAGSGGDVRLLRQQPMAVHDRGRDIAELGVGPARLVAQHLEGLSVIYRMTLHQDALCPLGDRSTAERALEVVVLRESAEHDVDRALPVLDVGVCDVREDSAL